MYAHEMKAYVRPAYTYLVLGIAVTVFGLWMLPQKLWFGLMELGGGALLLWVHFIARDNHRQIIRDLEKSALMLQAIADFPESTPMAKDRIRLGKRYLYSKRLGVILAYRDISRLELEIRPGKDLQNLTAITFAGKRHLICTLPYNKKGNGDMAILIMTIQAKGPEILLS